MSLLYCMVLDIIEDEIHAKEQKKKPGQLTYMTINQEKDRPNKAWNREHDKLCKIFCNNQL